MIVFNYSKKGIVSKKHICYFTEVKNDGIYLKEVVELTIRHPEAPEDAYVKKMDYEIVCKTDRVDNSERSAHIFLLDYAQRNTRNTMRDNPKST
jgi:hypothetical protein